MDADKVLWLALAARHAGERFSKMAGIEQYFDEHDPGVLEFNLTCGYRLEVYDSECRKQQAKLIAYEVGELVGNLLGGGDS